MKALVRNGLARSLSIVCVMGVWFGCTSEEPDYLVLEHAIKLESSTTFAVEGTFAFISLSLEDRRGDQWVPVDHGFTISLNGDEKGEIKRLWLNEAGTYELQAFYDGEVSNTLQIEVRPKVDYEPAIRTVVFHIIHDGEEWGEGANVNPFRLPLYMDYLNRVFNNSGSSTPNTYAANIKFELARQNPTGAELSEPGIHRFERPDTSASVNYEDWMWQTYWDPDYYINIWVGDLKGGPARGTIPSSSCDEDQRLPGISCLNTEAPTGLEGIIMSSNFMVASSYDLLAHEMGHMFGLKHVFLGGCAFDGDHCADTRNYDREKYEEQGSSGLIHPCEGLSFVGHNVMDYGFSGLNTPEELTYDQVRRIRSIVEFGNWRGRKKLDEGTPRDMWVLFNGG